MSLLKGTLILLGQDPTLTISFNLNYFLTPITATWAGWGMHPGLQHMNF